MPQVYRSMLADGGKPKVGAQSKMLGVRVQPHANADIVVDDQGNVHPNTGGMSVAPGWRQLPSFLIPKRLRHLAPDACGRNQLVCWQMGEGAFVAARLADDLQLQPDADKPMVHGVIEPAQSMSIAQYQSSLAATRDHWMQDEN
ncbi:MAG: hypothetical protein L0Y71_04205 [Gemmataceae bacterium]|nr:hypothetical protein [Gemmataceae bacterium]